MAPTTKLTTSSRLIHATNLDPETFAAFGEVVQNPATHSGSPQDLDSVSANQGTATKWLDVSPMQNFYHLGPSRKAANAVINMFVCQPRELEETKEGNRVFAVKVLERHPFTPQMFVPLGVCPNNRSARYLVIVAPTKPLRDAAAQQRSTPPYPTEAPRRRRSLKDVLLGSRSNSYTSDHASSTTPPNSAGSKGPVRKGPGPPDLSRLQAFIARGDQAVTYGPGTWHAPMVALGKRPIDFVVVQYANGVALEDCQEVEIATGDDGKGLAVDIDLGGVESVKAKL